MRSKYRSAALAIATMLALPVLAQPTASVRLSDDELSFHGQTVGAASSIRSVTLTIRGAAVTFSPATIGGANPGDFAIKSDTCSGNTVLVDGTCQIGVAFTPVAAGDRDAKLTLADSAPGKPPVVDLSGRGLNPRITRITILPFNPSLGTDARLQLAALASYSDGSSKDVTALARWKSSDPDNARVSNAEGSKGLATGVSPGKSIVIAALEDAIGQDILTTFVVPSLTFSVQPSSTSVSAAIDPIVRVRVVDNRGAPLRGQLLAMSLGSNPPNPAVLSGVLSRFSGDDGTAAFPGLKLDYLGQGYTLVATAITPGGPFSATSIPFDETRVGDPCLAPDATSGSCPDTDNDGLNDAWEIAGGIDFNGDGVVSGSEMVLTNFDPLLPDGTANPHPSAEVGRKDVFLRYDTMQVPDSGVACTTASDAGGHCSGSGAACTSSASCASPQSCVIDQYCVGHCSVTAARACNTVFDCGGRCSVTTANSCIVDADCPSAETCVASGEQCVDATGRGHSDAPSPAALMQVINAFSDHNINLHISPEHQVVPHSIVVSYGPPIDGCATPAGHLSDFGRAIDFYQVKPAETTGSGPQRPFIHYALFGHLHTCDSLADCNSSSCPTNPDTGFKPKFRETGLAEIVGNDLIVAYGATTDGNGGKAEPNHFAMAGTFMHELGHNLGLNHGGPIGHSDSSLNFKPNYLSVMNYSFQKTGIGTASPNCVPGDSLCKITPVTTRVDYANSDLAPLDETNLNETIGINSGTNDITVFFCPGAMFAPGTGPIDWDCNGDGGTELISGVSLGLTSVDIDNNLVSDLLLTVYADWPNLNFKFQQNAQHFGDGAAPGGITSQELDLETSLDKHILYQHKVAEIVIRPGCSAQSKPIAPGQLGAVPVALLGSDDLDVTEVDPKSLKFHGAAPSSTSIRDVNGDGKPDLVAVFDMSGMKLHASAVKGTLTGWLHSSQAFLGSDFITILPSMALVDQSCR